MDNFISGGSEETYGLVKNGLAINACAELIYFFQYTLAKRFKILQCLHF